MNSALRPSAGVTSDGRAFCVQPQWQEQVLYWEGDDGYRFDAGWGVEPPVLYVPTETAWDDLVPAWLRGRRAVVLQALVDVSGHVPYEDVRGSIYRATEQDRAYRVLRAG